MEYRKVTSTDSLFFADQTIEKAEGLTGLEYERCTFLRCSLSEADLSDKVFWNCEFIECDLSLVVIKSTSLREVAFKGCKMLGLHFDDCSSFGFSVRFENCLLKHSVFETVKMPKTVFDNCDLSETIFAGADLHSSTFNRCNMAGALFEGANLTKADLSSSFNYIIDPVETSIKGAKFSLDGLSGLLQRFGIIITE